MYKSGSLNGKAGILDPDPVFNPDPVSDPDFSPNHR